MSTKSENAEIAVLQTQMEDVKSDLAEVKVGVNKLLDRFETTASSFVTKMELKAIVEKFEADVKAARNFNWVTHSISAILGAFLIAVAYWIVAGFHK